MGLEVSNMKPQEYERVVIKLMWTLIRFRVIDRSTFNKSHHLSGFAWTHGYRKQGY